MADENNNQFNTPEQNSNNQYFQPTPQPAAPTEEKASVGLAILSYIIPLLGLILFLTKKESRPKTAKICGKCALASFIINIAITIIMYAVMGAAIFSEVSDEEVDTVYSDTIDAESGTIKTDNTLGDYVCVVKGAEKCKDWVGKDAVLITYEFTNNSSDAISFDVALDASAYQNGVGLETAILEEDTDLLDVDIKPGVTKEVKKAYVLRDNTTEVEIEVTELFSFSDEKIVTTVTL